MGVKSFKGKNDSPQRWIRARSYISQTVTNDGAAVNTRTQKGSGEYRGHYRAQQARKTAQQYSQKHAASRSHEDEPRHAWLPTG
jgi:hypothetical protein